MNGGITAYEKEREGEEREKREQRERVGKYR